MRPGHEDLQPPFTTYYEQMNGKYWFPTYTKAEGELHFAAQNGALSEDVHIRSTVRYTDYKRSAPPVESYTTDRTSPTKRTLTIRTKNRTPASRQLQPHRKNDADGCERHATNCNSCWDSKYK